MIYGIGIDPGLTESHWFLVGLDPNAPLTAFGRKYIPLACGVIDNKSRDLNTWDFGVDFHRAVDLAQVVVVESSREYVDHKRDPDFVLQNASMGGKLMGMQNITTHAPVLEAPANAQTMFAWRPALGVLAGNAKGLKQDAQVERLVLQRLNFHLVESIDIPTGTRGGKVNHHFDAAGIIIASMDRLTARLGVARWDRKDIYEAFYTPTPMEEVAQQRKQVRKAGNRVRRKAQKA